MTDLTIPYAAANELEDIRDEMLQLLERAEAALRNTDCDPVTRERARVYWIAHIKSALGSDEYRTHATTMESTIEELNA